jgi:hypothetical protein
MLEQQLGATSSHCACQEVLNAGIRDEQHAYAKLNEEKFGISCSQCPFIVPKCYLTLYTDRVSILPYLHASAPFEISKKYSTSLILIFDYQFKNVHR